MLGVQKYSLQKRIRESARILLKYPDRVPIICKHLTVPMKKNNFLVPKDMTVGELIVIIRLNINLKKEHAIFMFVNNKIIPTNTTLLSQLYCLYKNEDGFLYISFSEENAFG